MTQPEIRFNGFSDEWVEKKLGDVYSFSKGTGISKQSLSMDKSLPKGIPYGDLFTIYNSVIKDVERSTTDINGPMSNGTEILIPASSTVPLGPAQVSAILQSDVRLGGDIIIGKPLNNGLNNIFVAISATANKHKMYRFISGSTISHISAIGVASVPIQLPTLPEQQKIGSLFSKYDAIIALREQKLAELNALKKGMLQQMFDDGVATSHKPQATSHKPQATSHK